ncbi:BACON domain-containing protein [Alistipes sp.]|uniref:BACON domain-containing protein n=1 Tax=Alistipes sp. TaxID=1872444 RepID=UPI003AEF84CF
MKNTWKVLTLWAAALLFALAAGCQDDDTAGSELYLDAGTNYLALTKRGVTYDGANARIDLRSNTYWTASLSDEAHTWLALDRMGGEGDAEIELTVGENDGEKRTADITFRTLRGLRFTVTVSQSAAGEAFYYYKEDFGTGASMADASEYPLEPTGVGIFRGGYSAAGAYVDSTSPSDGYEGASGGNNLYLEEPGAFVSYGAFNILKDTDFVLSFASMSEGETFDAENLKLYISRTGQPDTWAEVPYERAATPGWSYTRVPFFIREGVGQLYVKAVSESGGYRIDDLSLDEGDESGDTIEFPEEIVNWVERILFQDNFEWMTSDKGTSALPGSDGDRFDSQYSGDMHGWTVDPVFVYVRPGFPKLGKTNAGGGLVTPKLDQIGEGTLDIVVEFDAAQYNDDFDALTVAVKNGGLIASTEEASTTFNIASRNAFTHFTVEVVRATRQTQIQFRAGTPDATQAAQSRSNRFFFDNVKIYYKEKIAGPGQVSVDTESVTIPAEGTAQKVVVESTVPWTVDPADEWVVCTPASGDAGTTEVFVSAATTWGSERNSSLTFAAGEATARVEVAQEASKLDAPVPACTVSEPCYVIFEWPRIEHAFAGQSYAYELYEGAAEGTPVRVMEKQAFTKSQFDTRVAFPNLKPATKYYLRVKALSSDAERCGDSPYSAFAEGETAAERTADPEALLEMHFDRLRWGSDYIRGAYGMRPAADADEKSATSFDVPLTRIAEPQTSISDYMSFTPQLREAAGLTGWTGSYNYGHLGAMKVGGWKKTGYLATPALEKIAGTKDIALTFRLCAYIDYGEGKTSDSKTMTLAVEGGGTPEETQFGMENFSWTTHTVVVRGATASTKIRFNTASNVDGRRFLIDDIVIREVGDSKPMLPAPVPAFSYAEARCLAFEWPRIEHASSGQQYAYELRKGSPNGVVVKSVSKQTLTDLKYDARVVFTYLEPSTKYYFTVKALSKDAAAALDSDFSAPVAGETLAPRTPDPAAVLEMYFDNFLWGGDYMRGAYGFRPGDGDPEKTATETTPANVQVVPATSIGDYFNTGVNPAFRNGYAGLAGWSGSKVYGLACTAKLGAGSSQGWIQTPELAAVQGTQNLVVTFKACPWIDYGTGKTSDSKTLNIEVTGGGTPDRTSLTMGDNFVWSDQTVRIAGATAATRVKFIASGAKNCRLLLDDIVIRTE